jgi:hypothetical protein
MKGVMNEQLRCKRCTKALNSKTAVHTRAGPFCKRHADRLPPHLRRISRATKEGNTH